MSHVRLQSIAAVMTFLLVVSRLVARGDAMGPDEKAVREVIAQVDRGDSEGRDYLRALVTLVKDPPAHVPVLVDTLKSGSPSARAFAAQALAIIAHPSGRPALQEALSDAAPQVRAYAVYGLSMLGKIEPSHEPYRTMLEKDSDERVRQAVAWAMERDDGPADAALMRERLTKYNLARFDTARLDEPAPDFELMDAFGKTYRLADFIGKKPVVLKFYHEPL